MRGDKTVKEHLLAVWKKTGKKPKPLVDQGDCPDGFGQLWSWFTRLSWRRGRGMGAMPITYQDMDAFARLNAIDLAPWQVRSLEHLDAIWMNTHG